MPQKEYFGFGSIKNLQCILEKENSKNIFLITGKNSYELCKAKDYIDRLKGFSFTRFSNFSSNPKIEQIQEGLKLFNQRNYDILVAVGGGSSIDVAKAIKLFALEKTPERKLPLIAIPTTAGSGSEATHFIVYYEGKEKQSKGKLEITLPEYVICDPELTISLSKEVAASTGMDAFAQAVESYWSINSSSQSKEFAKQAIVLLIGNLEKSILEKNRIAKANVMKAANLAGKAINISKTTACHSIAYPITSYFGVSHGHAAGLTLGEMLVYNSNLLTQQECNDSRGMEYVKNTTNELIKLIGFNKAFEAKNFIENLMIKIGLKTRLSLLKIDENSVEKIIEKGFNPERVKNNPRFLTEQGLRKILKSIL